jgi:hypothetical protein
VLTNIEKGQKMKKVIVFFFIAFTLLQGAYAQDWRPGKMREDAPDGKIVKIPSGDIHIWGVIYYPKSAKGDEKLIW